MGQTSRPLKIRFREHKYNSGNRKNKVKTFLYSHFRQTGHSFNKTNIQIVEDISFESNTNNGNKNKTRYNAELQWIKKLQTPFPLGLNDNIYQIGNISKDTGIDIFSLFSSRRRKTRSHGRRRNRNIKRKNRKDLSLLTLHTIRKQSGTHGMLSVLASAPITKLLTLDSEASQIISRNDPLYMTACITESFTQHKLRPHIDDKLHHKRYFLKINFLNKGIDLIDLPSIFNNKEVAMMVPSYFKNREPPLICYKYKKPIRNILFNYNQTVADLNIEENAPLS